jgi:hypothetical protein
MRYLAIIAAAALLASCHTSVVPRPIGGEGIRLLTAPVVRPGRVQDAGMAATGHGRLVVRVTTAPEFPANLLTVQLSSGDMSSGLMAVGTQGFVAFTPSAPGVYTVAANGPGFVSQFVSLSLTAGFVDTLDVHLAPP